MLVSEVRYFVHGLFLAVTLLSVSGPCASQTSRNLGDSRSAAVDGVMERDLEWRDSYRFSWLDATFHRKHG